jgi:hypothetical protein
VHFDLSIGIDRPPADVFAHLLHKDRVRQEADSPVLVLDKLTPGEPDVGTRYREVVRMPTGWHSEILSCITRCEPPRLLEEDFTGPGPMHGHLAYEFSPAGEGTLLRQRETLEVTGPARVFSGVIRLALGKRLRNRLEGIKTALESGLEVGPPA